MNSIKLEDLAAEFGRRLGSDFRVTVDALTRIMDDFVVDVIFKAKRVPFAIRDIESETLEVSIDIWAKADNEATRSRQRAAMAQIIGYLDGEVESGGQFYKYASYLEHNSSYGPPEIHQGSFKMLHNISGTILVSDAERGGIISNEVLVKLEFDHGGGHHEGYIPVTSFDENVSYQSEPSAYGNNTLSDLEDILKIRSFNINGLFLRRTIDRALRSAVRDVSPKMTVTIVEEGLENVVRCKVTSMRFLSQAGAYWQYGLSLQEVNDG